MAFMGGLDVQGIVDKPGISEEAIRKEVRRCIDTYGPEGHYVLYGASTSAAVMSAYAPGGNLFTVIDEAARYQNLA